MGSLVRGGGRSIKTDSYEFEAGHAAPCPRRSNESRDFEGSNVHDVSGCCMCGGLAWDDGGVVG